MDHQKFKDFLEKDPSIKWKKNVFIVTHCSYNSISLKITFVYVYSVNLKY